MLPKLILCKKKIVDNFSPRRWRGHFVSKGRWIATDCRLWRVQQQQQQQWGAHTRSLINFHLLHLLAYMRLYLTRSLGYTFKFEV